MTEQDTDEGINLPADWEPKHGYVLSIGPGGSPDEVIAIISDGTPQNGDKNVIVLTLEKFGYDDQAKIREWFEECMQTKPWITRN